MKSSVRQTAVCWRSAGLGRGCASVFWEHYSIKQSLNMHLHVSLHSRTQDTESGILNHFYLSVSSFCTYSVMVVIRTLPYLQCCFFLYSVRMTELNFLERQGSLWHWGLLAKDFKKKQGKTSVSWSEKQKHCHAPSCFILDALFFWNSIGCLVLKTNRDIVKSKLTPGHIMHNSSI